jgi:hypothetical protein
MRAREFITEQAAQLPPEQADPMRYTYVIPGLSAADPYRNYRFGVAVARARSEYRKDEVNPNMPEWHDETAFGEHGIVAGMNPGIAKIIDAALKMTNTPGGKRMVSTPTSTEPSFVDTVSPVKAFKGYPR